MRFGRWSRPVWIAVGGVVIVVGLNRWFVHVVRDRPPAAMRRLRSWFRAVNPVVVRMAERGGLDQPVLYHVGRRTGAEHATPLCVTDVPGAFIVPAAFGADVDWLANLRATPRARLRHHGRLYQVEAEVVDAGGALRVAGHAAHCGCWEEYRVGAFAVLRPVAMPDVVPRSG